MSNLVLVAAVVAAFVAVTVVADGEEAVESFSPFRSTQTQCQREVEESALDACRQVMHNVVYKVPGEMLRWSPGLHVRCCQQLLGVRRECRHAAIRGLVREYEVLEQGSGETMEQQGFQGESTEQEQQGDWLHAKSRAHRRHRVEGHELGQTARQQEGQGYGLPSAPGFTTEQQAAPVRLMKARHFAARLPVTCRFETALGRDASSAGLD